MADRMADIGMTAAEAAALCEADVCPDHGGPYEQADGRGYHSDCKTCNYLYNDLLRDDLMAHEAAEEFDADMELDRRKTEECDPYGRFGPVHDL